MTEYSYIPKSIKRVNEESQFGLSKKFVFLSIFMGFLSLILIAKAVSSVFRLYITLIIIIIVWVFIICFFRTPTLWNRSVTILSYSAAYLTDKCTVRKYKDTEAKLFDIVWIKEFHTNGNSSLIEFFGDKYAILLKSDPDKISDDEINSYIEKVKQLVDSIGLGKMISFYVSSVSVISDRPLENTIVQSLSDAKSQKERDHLYGLYDEIRKDKTPQIRWNFYILVDIGVHKSVNDAEISMQHYFPGIEQRLIQTDMHIVPVSDRFELMKLYHGCIIQEEY